ncbi:MAG: glycosyltransferase [Haloechinothrix sp.]
MHTAPVLAVVVCHDGEAWLPLALSALRRSTVRPHRVIAVDTGSTDRTAILLADAQSGENRILDDVLTLTAGTGFAEAVAAGVEHATARFDDAGDWLWLLHDDCAPEADCLATLLNAAAAAPSAGVLGPLAVDWADPRLIVEAGLSTDASGHRRSDAGIGERSRPGRADQDHGRAEQSTEVLAMPSAGSLIQRELWDTLGGFDDEFALCREDLDFGWRANVAGRTVLCVPRARIRHVRAAGSGQRVAGALRDGGVIPDSVAAADRAYGLRTFLVNCSGLSFVLGVPRLTVLSVLRGVGFALIKEGMRARAEFTAVRYLLGGHGGLRAARAERAGLRAQAARSRRTGPAKYRRNGGVRGLFIGRPTRLRHAMRAGVLHLVRRGVATEAALGRLPESAGVQSAWVPPEAMRARRGAPAIASAQARAVVAVPVHEDAVEASTATDTEVAVGDAARPAEAPAVRRPAPRTAGGAAAPSGLVFVEVSRRRILAATLFAPPVLLVLALTALAMVVNGGRLGLDLTGGRLLPVGDLGQVWSSYLAGWHPIGGGTSAQAPAALAVLGVLGGLFLPLGGPAAAVAVLLILDIPLAGLSAYLATRRLRVRRWVRALVAAGYAVLPPATVAVAQGRLDVVVVHLLLPLVIAGVAGVLRPRDGGARWLSASVTVALGLALLGAFSPLVHMLVLVGLLVGFVVVNSTTRMARRVASVATVVLLPIALLLPWPTMVLRHPEVLLHGVGGRVGEVPVTGVEMFSLDPGGPGALPIGAVLVVTALIALIVRPTIRSLAGLGIGLLGVAGVAIVQLVPATPLIGGAARHGWTGAPLIGVGIGLLAIVLAASYQERGAARRSGTRLPLQLAALGGVVVLAVFVVSAAVVGPAGPLRQAESVRLAAPLAAELADTGRSVLVLNAEGEPPRQTGGGMPAFGDDDYALPPDASQRLLMWQNMLIGGPGVPSAPPQVVRDVVASASAAGVLFVVLPPGVDSAALIGAGGEVVTTAAPTVDGRQVVRLKPVSGQVTLIAPELSRLAVGGKAPLGDIEGEGVAPVDAGLPEVRVRVSDGPGGRLLVLAANLEAGWRATVDGEPKPIVPAWGHQVGVEVPTRESEVVVENPKTARNMLLLGQVGAVLFTLLTAIPARSGRASRPR